MDPYSAFTQQIERLRELADKAGLDGANQEVFDGLLLSLETLRTADEELRRQNEALQAARQAAEAERQRYERLFAFAPVGFCITDLYSKVLEVNQAASRLLNMPVEILTGRLLVSFVEEEHRYEFRRLLTQLKDIAENGAIQQVVAAAQPHYLEIIIQPKRGEPFYAALLVSIGFDTDHPVLQWLIHDITERSKARFALKESEARFRTLAETASLAIFLVGNEKILYANPAASQISGLSTEELNLRAFLSLVEPEDQHLLKSILAQDGGPAPAPQRCELRLILSKGKKRWVDINLWQTYLQAKSVWAITAYDITARIQTEKKNHDLLRRVVTLQEDERKRISREIHDHFGQSISVLLLGLKSLKTQLPAEQAPLLQQLEQTADQLGQELHDLSVSLRPTALDDLGLATALANFTEQWSRQQHIPLDFQSMLKPGERFPEAITNTVYRVIQEGLNNILRHAAASRVSLVLSRQKNHLHVVLEDDGCGFDPEEILERHPGRQQLGLIGMKERVELVNGSVEIESMPGKGTTLYVHIPIPHP